MKSVFAKAEITENEAEAADAEREIERERPGRKLAVVDRELARLMEHGLVDLTKVHS